MNNLDQQDDFSQKPPSRRVLSKRCSENMQQIYRRTPMPKCDFNKVALQLYWNHTSAWVFSCKFAAYFQNTFFQQHLVVAASVSVNRARSIPELFSVFVMFDFIRELRLLDLVEQRSNQKKIWNNRLFVVLPS